MKVLAIRFSAIGDVTMLLPVFQKALEANPELEISFVTRPFFKPLFTGQERLHFIGIDLKGYKNLAGLVRLALYLKSRDSFDLYLDLHDSLRTRILRSLWRLSGKKVFVLDKGRAEKALLTRKNNKQLLPLMHAVDRYLLVFKKAGLYSGTIMPAGIPEDTGMKNWLPAARSQTSAFIDRTGMEAHQLIGYAPFAGFTLKELPAEKSRLLLALLLKNFPAATFILFGGRENQVALEQLKNDVQGPSPGQSVRLASDLVPGFDAELGLITSLSLMLSMDSGNMHLAAVCGVPVVGLFGTTHPYAGFTPFGQEASGSLGLDGLECRPCTIYGKGMCYRGDFACMDQLPLQLVIDRVKEKLVLPFTS